PSELLAYSQADVTPPESVPSATEDAASKKAPKPVSHLASKNSKATGSTPPAVQGSEQVPLPAVAAPAVVPSPKPSSETAGLQIAITSTTNDGTLAVFSDQNLLFTTELHAGSAEPLHLERSLPAGPHQLRVALYRPDKSLLSQKEGLTDLRTDNSNTLAIRVSHHKKILLRREDTLEVTWPSSSTASAEHTMPPPPARSFSLK
ncbi:MAG TPA: hypothetical protein VFF42_07615, partial [Candidatus Eremiobacteraceae bacterium]|nr:hypothetical protein [Candidatus Eremiobacteraceae bacterium]